MPPAFGAVEQTHEPLSRKGSSKRPPASGGDHADGHGRSYREPGREHPPRKRIAHDERGQRTWNHTRHECECPAVLGVCVAVASQRAPEQEGADQRDQHATGSLELRRAAAIGEGPTAKPARIRTRASPTWSARGWPCWLHPPVAWLAVPGGRT